MSQNISTNGIKSTLTLFPLPPFELDNFSPDTDMIVPEDLETGAIEMTPDGKAIRYTKNASIPVSITLNAASKAAIILRECILQQRRNGVIPPISFNATLVIEDLVNNITEIYTDGVLIGGPTGYGYGDQKKHNQTFKFEFPTRKSIGG